MKIFVLNDNRKNAEFESEHGFSLLIKVNGKSILFDSGETNVFINNAKLLSIDLNEITDIVLSHGDYDHANGLKHLQLKNKVCLYAHPSIFDVRISKRRGVYAGINQTKENLQEKYNLILAKNSTKIDNEIFFLGEIERLNALEINLPMLDENGKDFLHIDDSGLAIKTEKGLVIISGCAHSGICNTINHAIKVCDDNRIYAVIGGFHLKDQNEKLEYTINFLNDIKCENTYLAHCTSDKCIAEFKKRLNGVTHVVKAGDEIYL